MYSCFYIEIICFMGEHPYKGGLRGYTPVPYMDMSLISGRGFSSVVERIMKGLC